MKYKEIISYFIKSRLSPIFNGPRKTAHSIVEDALHVIEGEAIPYGEIARAEDFFTYCILSGSATSLLI
jgi:fatty acid-binding protein DegV